MDFQTAYYAVSGLELDRCAFLGQRWDNDIGYDSNEGEFWLMTLQGTAGKYSASVLYHYDNLAPGVWLAESGACYFMSPFGEVLHNPNVFEPKPDQWSTTRVWVGAARGIWGLSEACIFAWGVSNKTPTR